MNMRSNMGVKNFLPLNTLAGIELLAERYVKATEHDGLYFVE